MVDVTIGDLLEEVIQNPSKVIFENEAGLTKRDIAENLQFGSAVVVVHSINDLPPVVDGFITLAQDVSYMFFEPFIISDPILIPAGWIGTLRKPWINSTSIIYTGTGAFLNTLNIDGSILSIADSGAEPGVKSTVTVSAPHGLLDGQYVNITGTLIVPAYSQQRLQISNVTASTFDVAIVFTITDTGLFNTGFDAIQLIDFGGINFGTANYMDLTSSGSAASSIIFTRFAEAGFLSPGIIRNATVMSASDSVFPFILDGLTLENVVAAIITASFISLNPAVPTAKGITITGVATRRIALVDSSFLMTNPAQRPVRVDASITAADEILLQNSPDNNIATDYFDTSAGGLDQTNPQILTENNGIRANAMSSAQVGFTNISTPIVVSIVTQDVPVIIGGTQFTSANLERATANIAGQITNTTTVTRKYPITFSALIEKVGGGVTDIGLLIIKNGSLVLTDTFNIPHSVNAGVIQISATRDFELSENDTIELAVVNFDGTSNIEVSQANIVYSTEA